MRHAESRLVEDADESAPVRLGNRPYRGTKVDSLLYHDLLDCDSKPQTNSLRYLCQITLLREL